MEFPYISNKICNFRCSRSFNIINPTEDDLVFSWEQLKSSEKSSVPLFSCAQLSGTITRGKMAKATFSVLPQTTGTFEALYNFKLESYNFTSLFLFVANIREPKIYFLQPYLNIKPTVYGISVCDYITLKNEENIDLHFKFRKSSLFSETRKECLTTEPRTGIVSRLSETQIKYVLNQNVDLFYVKTRLLFVESVLNLRKWEKKISYYNATWISVKCHWFWVCKRFVTNWNR